ncbi:hypothetical protein V1512DRAFT_258590 [Lipomyces arxii]|uniref:uncharacterized protein n=1 Tax=Lipomyces arxii TaxID=56418 RepID=UPI0034CD9A5C
MSSLRKLGLCRAKPKASLLSRKFATTRINTDKNKPSQSPEDIISLFLSLPDDPPATRLDQQQVKNQSSKSGINQYPNEFKRPTLSTIRATVRREILSHDTPVPTAVTGDAIEAIEKVISQIPPHGGDSVVDVENPREKATELIYTVLKHPPVILDDALMRRYFLLRPDTSRAIEAIKIYNARSNGQSLSKQTFMIPFRKSLREEDSESAFEILDLTAASPQWLAGVKAYWRRMAGVWMAGTGSIMYISELVMKSDVLVAGGITHTGVIQTMIFTYLVNSSLMAFVGLASRPGDNGGKVAFRHGIFQTKWYLHAQETRMLNMILDMDAENVANEGEMSPLVEYQLFKRNRRIVNGAYDDLITEYWAKQGQGFEWVEPDIDPAEEEKNIRDQAKLNKLSLTPAHHQKQLIDDQNADWIKRVLSTQTEK